MATIEATVENGVGRLLLNRPQALNAMDGPMYFAMGRALDAWAADPAVRVVTIRGAGKAFCAGGDVRYTLASYKDGDGQLADAGYAEEYRVDQLIHGFPKPLAAVVHGICMGGGMALAMYARHRVLTEQAILAMPETAIGLFPDCGLTWSFSRLPGAVGMYLGLTGARINAADARALGLATHVVAPEHADAVESMLANGSSLDALEEIAPAPGPIAEHRAQIDTIFGQGSVPAIAAALATDGSPWATQALATLRAMSPTSLAITLELLRRVHTATLEHAFAIDGVLAPRLSRTPEYAEGVRAVIIDKDRNPKWHPARIEDVDPSTITALLDEVEAVALRRR
jgi:enoyl-CoA hydratase